MYNICVPFQMGVRIMTNILYAIKLVTLLVFIINSNGCSDSSNDVTDIGAENDLMELTDSDIIDDTSNQDGCSQELPAVTTRAAVYCDVQFPDSCLFNLCGNCQVCYVDISAPPQDPSTDGPIYYCLGDGLCHDLCATDLDCGENEECINLAWFNGYDALPSSCLKVCWTKGDPDVDTCIER